MDSTNKEQLPNNSANLKKSWYSQKRYVAIIILLIIFIGVCAWSYFRIQKNTISKIVTTNVQPKLVTSQMIGPITIQATTPLLEYDKPDSNSNDVVILGDDSDGGDSGEFFPGIPTSEQTSWQTRIIAVDPEIHTIRSHTDALDDVQVIYMSPDSSFVLYMTDLSAAACEDQDSLYINQCGTANIKLFNTKDSSIHQIGDSIPKNTTILSMLVNTHNNSLIIQTGNFNATVGQYQAYSLNSPYGFLEQMQTPQGSVALYQNEYQFSYVPKTGSFSLDNLVTDQVFTCLEKNLKVNQILSTLRSPSFDPETLTIANDGNSITLLYQGMVYILNTSVITVPNGVAAECAASPKSISLPASIDQESDPVWYDNGRYLGFSGSDSYLASPYLWVYDFGAQKAVFSMQSDTTTQTVGDLENTGYHNEITINNTDLIRVVPGDKDVSLYFVTPNQQQYLIGEYADPLSSKKFYALTLQYPLNSLGSNTAWLTSVGEGLQSFPVIFARVEADSHNRNLFHIVVLNGWHLVQGIDLTIDK